MLSVGPAERLAFLMIVVQFCCACFSFAYTLQCQSKGCTIAICYKKDEAADACIVNLSTEDYATFQCPRCISRDTCLTMNVRIFHPTAYLN